MPNSLSEEQKQLLLNILRHPEDDDAKIWYSQWLRENGEESQAQFVERAVTAKSKTNSHHFTQEKKDFSSDMMQAIGLFDGEDHSYCGFTVKIDAENLLLNNDFLTLHFNEKGSETKQIQELCDVIVKSAGKKVLASLAVGQIHDSAAGKQATSADIVMKKMAIQVAEEEYQRAVVLAQSIHDKAKNIHSAIYDTSAQLIHKMTGEHPEGYVGDKDNMGSKNYNDKHCLSHASRIRAKKIIQNSSVNEL